MPINATSKQKRARDNPAKHFVLAFAIALIVYVVSYSWIQHRRNRKGPWEVSFTHTNGMPAIVINQVRLGLTNVTLVFEGQSATAATNSADLEFRVPKQTPFPVAFADCVFEDLTFLPGTVTLHAYNHEIEFLPRVLVIDQKENEWSSGAIINLPRKPKPDK